jgi:hypothetical protein
VFFPSGTSLTDDLGQFRISGLEPGTYYLMASTREMWVGDKRETYGYAATYFPGGTRQQAQRITLAAAEDRQNLDFRLTVSRTARVSGQLQSATGASIEGQTVTIAPEYRGTIFIAAGALLQTARTARDGSFAIENVPPGEYLLQSRAGQVPQGTDEVASLQLDVTGADIDALQLLRQRGTTVAGSIVTDEAAAPPFQPSILRASPIASDPDKQLRTSILVTLRDVKADWSFVIPNIAGPYLFRLDGLPADWMIKSVRLDERDITDTPLEVPTGGKQINDLQIMLTRRAGKVTGNVVDERGAARPDATIVLFADDPERWGPGSRFLKMTRPTSDGRFSFSGLPEGAYRVIARDDIVDGQWEDREFLAGVRDAAQRFELPESGTREITLKLSLPR